MKKLTLKKQSLKEVAPNLQEIPKESLKQLLGGWIGDDEYDLDSAGCVMCNKSKSCQKNT